MWRRRRCCGYGALRPSGGRARRRSRRGSTAWSAICAPTGCGAGVGWISTRSRNRRTVRPACRRGLEEAERQAALSQRVAGPARAAAAGGGAAPYRGHGEPRDRRGDGHERRGGRKSDRAGKTGAGRCFGRNGARSWDMTKTRTADRAERSWTSCWPLRPHRRQSRPRRCWRGFWRMPTRCWRNDRPVSALCRVGRAAGLVGSSMASAAGRRWRVWPRRRWPESGSDMHSRDMFGGLPTGSGDGNGYDLGDLMAGL